jgi:prepilin signal peptidase PulO-like enzyme (type II secretory pathway)
MLVAVLFLAWFGLAFGSFLNAMVWRMHKKKDWVKGRSECDFCKHKLSALDLIPVFSWLYLRGRCRYCRKRLSWQHPAVELATAAVFVLSYIFWPVNLNGAGEWILFITWLAVSVGLMALLVYDARWMLLPNKILYPVFYIAVAGRLIYIIGTEAHKGKALLACAASVAVASGIFWLLFMASQGKWIGYGDVRLGLITGTVLADPARSLMMIVLGSLLGTLFILPALAMGKKKLASKLPYGPFLIAATWLVLLFGDKIMDWYTNFLKLN